MTNGRRKGSSPGPKNAFFLDPLSISGAAFHSGDDEPSGEPDLSGMVSSPGNGGPRPEEILAEKLGGPAYRIDDLMVALMHPELGLCPDTFGDRPVFKYLRQHSLLVDASRHGASPRPEFWIMASSIPRLVRGMDIPHPPEKIQELLAQQGPMY
ncbi:MAG: hypothetical protein V1735_03340 [Nanoarchaeota archaeon]